MKGDSGLSKVWIVPVQEIYVPSWRVSLNGDSPTIVIGRLGLCPKDRGVGGRGV